HPRPRRHLAGVDVGDSVDAHHALRAGGGEAEGAAGAVVLHRAGEDVLAGGEQRAGDRLAIDCLHRLTLQIEGGVGNSAVEARHEIANSTRADYWARMLNGLLHVPTPRNEPVLDYKPGSPERADLKATLERLAGNRIEIPLVIGGKQVRSG